MHGEYSHVPTTLTLLGLAVFVVYGRGFKTENR